MLLHRIHHGSQVEITDIADNSQRNTLSDTLTDAINNTDTGTNTHIGTFFNPSDTYSNGFRDNNWNVYSYCDTIFNEYHPTKSHQFTLYYPNPDSYATPLRDLHSGAIGYRHTASTQPFSK